MCIYIYIYIYMHNMYMYNRICIDICCMISYHVVLYYIVLYGVILHPGLLMTIPLDEATEPDWIRWQDYDSENNLAICFLPEIPPEGISFSNENIWTIQNTLKQHTNMFVQRSSFEKEIPSGWSQAGYISQTSCPSDTSHPISTFSGSTPQANSNMVISLETLSTNASTCQWAGWCRRGQRVWLKQNLNIEGWNSQVRREFPRSFESSNLSRDNLSGEIGRTSRSKSRFGARSSTIWNLESQGFDSVRFLLRRGGIPRSMGNSPET